MSLTKTSMAILNTLCTDTSSATVATMDLCKNAGAKKKWNATHNEALT